MLKLSISIPTWNRLPFLRKNIQVIIDAIAQLPEGLAELFVTDNHSDDGTADYLQSISEAYPFVRYHRHPKNLGANFNFYTALSKAEGEYIWLLGDDDLIAPDSLVKIIQDIDQYKPAVMIGGTEHDQTKKRVNVPDVKEHLLTDKRLLSDYDALSLAAKMSVLIFSKEKLATVLEPGWQLIEASKTPWPHIVWFLKLLASNESLLILPYITNYYIRANCFNSLQDGNLRMNLLFVDYANVIEMVQSDFSKKYQKALVSHITVGRIDELMKGLAYSTFLNAYQETLQEAVQALKKIPSWVNKILFSCFYMIPALLPIKLRHFLFYLPTIFCKPGSAYHYFIEYLQTAKALKASMEDNHRVFYNRVDL